MFFKVLWIFVLVSLGAQHTRGFDLENDDTLLFITEDEDDIVRFIEKPIKALSFREGYKYIEGTNSYYKEHTTPASWLHAVTTCEGEGAELALPKSRKEYQVLHAQFSRATEHIWLGLRDSVGDGRFLAPDGTPANITNLYTGVDQSEPYYDDGGDNSKCGVMNKNEQYVIFACDMSFRFICTRKRSTLQYNPNCGTDKGYFLKPMALSCFKMHTEYRNWTEAFRTCSEEKASLATVDSLEEMRLYVEIVENHPGSTKRRYYNNDIFWLGFCNYNGVVQTVQGEPLVEANYIRWARRPTGSRGNRHCGSMLRDGRLEVNACGTRAMFICEKSLTALDLNIDERK